MDQLFCDSPYIGVQFSSKEALNNSIIKNDDLQEFSEYKNQWFSKNKKKVRTFSCFNVKYHMIDDFFKNVKKPAHIPKDIRANCKKNRVEIDGQSIIICVGNVKLIIAVTELNIELEFSMGEASYSLKIDMNKMPKFLPKDCEAYFETIYVHGCHGVTCFIISKTANNQFSKEMTDYFESFIKKNLRVIINFLAELHDWGEKWIESAEFYSEFDWGLVNVPTKEVIDYEQKYNDTVPKKRKMLGLYPNKRKRIAKNFYVSNTSRTVGRYNLCGEYNFFETVYLDERDKFYEIPTHVTKITDVREGSNYHGLIKEQDFVLVKKAGSKNKLSINFSQHLHEHNKSARENFESRWDKDYWYTLLYPKLELLEVNSMTLKAYDKKIDIEDNAFRCIKAQTIDLSQAIGLKEIASKKVFNVELIGKLIISKDVQISRCAFVVEDKEMINPEFSIDEKIDELMRRKEIKDKKIDCFMKNNIVMV